MGGEWGVGSGEWGVGGGGGGHVLPPGVSVTKV